MHAPAAAAIASLASVITDCLSRLCISCVYVGLISAFVNDDVTDVAAEQGSETSHWAPTVSQRKTH